MTIRPRRSMLYMPGSNARAIEKARELPADGVILDLEDAVAPDAKAQARELVVQALQKGGFGGREVLVRINGLDTAWWRDDLAVAAAGPDALLLPKVSTPEQLRELARHFVGVGAEARIRVWAMIETPLAMLNAREIAAAALDPATRLAGFVMGTNDLAKETRARIVPGRAPMLPWLMACVARGARLRPRHPRRRLQRTRRFGGFRAECQQARDLGFDGKTLIHPQQIAPCNAVFSPAPEEVAGRGRSSPPSTFRKMPARGSSRSKAAWSSGCTRRWRARSWRSPRPARRCGRPETGAARTPGSRLRRSSRVRKEDDHGRNRKRRHLYPDHGGEAAR